MSTQYYFRKWGGEATTSHRSSEEDTYTANHPHPTPPPPPPPPQIRSYSGWIPQDDPWVLTEGRSNGNNKKEKKLKTEVPWYEF